MSILLKKLFARLQAPEGDETSFVGSGAGGSAEPAASVDEPTGSDINWGEMSDSMDADETADVEGDVEVIEEAPAPVEVPAEPAPAEAPTPAPVEPVPAAPTPAPTPAPAPQPAAPSGEPSPTPDYQQWRAGKETDLAKTTYSITDEDATKLLTEPETVLPRMAARMHMEVLESAMKAMQFMLPHVMQSVQQGQQQENSAKQFFVSKNPDLADSRLEPAIFEMGAVYRRLNPAASADEAAVAIGNLVRASLGIAAPQPAGVPPASTAPAPQVRPAVPFVPARGGAGGGGAVAPTNPWTQLADEFGQDD